MSSGIAIGEYITVRTLKPFLDGARTQNGKQYLLQTIIRRIELTGFVLLTVVRVAARKYRIDEIMTEENSVVFDENELTLTANWYDIKRFSVAIATTYCNELFGEQTEFRMQGDLGFEPKDSKGDENHVH
ncbi:hypothetical protein FACS1894187_04470 [Synergistales bacterium]|nr:hypothetical protein FACS1894187_04470 [Synergistales bacterium]